MTHQEKIALKFKIAAAFTPSAPIDSETLFAGRLDQINRLLNSVSQKGQHAILFGERGVGKTSLANVLKEFLKKWPDVHFITGSTNCEATSTFQSIWKSVLGDICINISEVGIGFNAPSHVQQISLADLAGQPVKTGEDLRHFLQKLDKHCILIIDELDQISTKGTAKAIADAIKTLSDHNVDSTIVLVGVADSVDSLIQEHVSIERALVQIQMPRMSALELREIIEKGLTQVGMTIEESAKEKIGELSQGLPHYTHLLSLHAAQSSVDQGSLDISMKDVDSAINKSVAQAQQSIVSGYVTATTSRRGNLYAQVLTACAVVPKDELGYFSASDVKIPMTAIMGAPYEITAFSKHLNDFCEKSRGPILQRTGFPRRYRFRFTNPLMEPYVIMKALSKSILTPALLEELRY